MAKGDPKKRSKDAVKQQAQKKRQAANRASFKKDLDQGRKEQRGQAPKKPRTIHRTVHGKQETYLESYPEAVGRERHARGQGTRGAKLKEDDIPKQTPFDHFKTGYDYTTRMKATGDEMGGGQPDLKESPPLDHVPASDEIFSAWGDLSNYSPQKLAEIAAWRANRVRETMSSEIPQPQAQQIAVERGIEDIKRASREQDQGNRGIETSHLTPSNVREIAFNPTVRQLSSDEQKTYFPRARSPKTDVGKTDAQLEKGARSKQEGTGFKRKDTSMGPDGAPLHQAMKERKSTLRAGQQVEKAKISNQQFLRNLSPDEASWVHQEMNTRDGLFYGAKNNQVPGAYRRWQRYVNAREAGFDAPSRTPEGKESDTANVRGWLTAETRGRRTNPERRERAESKQAVERGQYSRGLQKKEGVKATDRDNSRPSHEDLGVGIRVPGIRSDRELKDKNPDASDKEIFQMRQSDIQSVDEFMQNQRMSHEQRQRDVLGKSDFDSAASNEERVVFFTTSTGYPAISTGANSLLGQYVIKKRKKMLYDQKMAPRALLKGQFPNAVRDQHVAEMATGLSAGAQGRYGAFRHVGWRAGSKKSKGYGKMLPVGSQILRDSSGQPLFDRNGNVRYSTGFTRPFDLTSSKELGLRVYLG